MAAFPAVVTAATAAHAAAPTVPLALATLVGVEGSSYQQPGARLLVSAAGDVLAGAVSGGCLEGDLASRAAHVCAGGEAILLCYDLREDLDAIWGFGSACEGVAHILLEPLHDPSWLERVAAARAARHLALTCTVTASAHEALPLGTLAVGVREGAEVAWWPTRPDGAAREARDALLVALGEPLHRLLAQPPHTYAPLSLSLRVAGTHVDVFLDLIAPPVALHVIGAGRGAEAFARIGAALGWQVRVFDHREGLLDALTLPHGVPRLPRRPEEGVGGLPHDAWTAVALMTHLFEVDRAWLSHWLDTAVPYIGILGSRRRGQRLLDAVSPRHGTQHDARHDALRRVHAPIGLDLGGSAPEDIALSAIAEIQAVLHGRQGGALRDREAPIHHRGD
jgi:xanthine/CO dehydrogenase XdhC/CoxF family maturation factor